MIGLALFFATGPMLACGQLIGVALPEISVKASIAITRRYTAPQQAAGGIITDIFIACVDGPKGFPEAIETVFPQTQVQLCLVHLMRHSLAFVGYKERKAVAGGLKAIYQAARATVTAGRLFRRNLSLT